jgi:hypothetical protein
MVRSAPGRQETKLFHGNVSVQANPPQAKAVMKTHQNPILGIALNFVDETIRYELGLAFVEWKSQLYLNHAWFVPWLDLPSESLTNPAQPSPVRRRF